MEDKAFLLVINSKLFTVCNYGYWKIPTFTGSRDYLHTAVSLFMRHTHNVYPPDRDYR